MVFSKTFKDEDITYVLEFDGVVVGFCIDSLNSSPRLIDFDTMDMLFGNDPPDSILTLTKSHNIIYIYSEIKKFFNSFIRKYKPMYFMYSANESAKFSAYKRFAEKITRQYDYNYSIYKDSFYFFKNP